MKINGLTKIALVSTLVLSTAVFAKTVKQQEAGLGFEMGTTFQNFSESHMDSGNTNYFRVIMKSDEQITYFMHNESGTISVKDGAAVSSWRQTVSGIGAKMVLAKDLDLSMMVGSSTINGAVSGTIAAVASTSNLADIGINWKKEQGKVSFNAGLVYRLNKLDAPVAIGTDNVNDMSGLNINLGLAYSF